MWSLLWIFKLGWAARLWHLGIVREWPWLTAYLVMSAVLSHVCAETIERHGWNSVASAWVLPLSGCLWPPILLCVVFEAYAHIDSAVRSVRTRNVLLAAGAVALWGNYLWNDYAPGSYWIQVEPWAYVFVLAVLLFCVFVSLVNFGWSIFGNPATVYGILLLWVAARAEVSELRAVIGMWWWAVSYTGLPLLNAGLMLAGIVLFRDERRAGSAS